MHQYININIITYVVSIYCLTLMFNFNNLKGKCIFLPGVLHLNMYVKYVTLLLKSALHYMYSTFTFMYMYSVHPLYTS